MDTLTRLTHLCIGCALGTLVVFAAADFYLGDQIRGALHGALAVAIHALHGPLASLPRRALDAIERRPRPLPPRGGRPDEAPGRSP